ncbi:MAG: LicD family protein [Ruminococcus sp.]|nr:LicD family protein [Ruminococcus sp.]
MEKELLRKLQLTELEIAKEVKRICDENGINYFMDSGTLLGAVRHKGFIPWDDDMDFGFLREDYEKFIKIAPKCLKDEYILQTWESDPYYPWAYSKVRKKDTLFVENMIVKAKHHMGVFVDLFPYDAYPDNKKDQKKHGRKIMRYRYIMLMKSNMTPWKGKKSALKKVAVFLKYKFYAFLGVFYNREKLIKKYDELMKKFNDIETEYVYEQSGNARYGKWIVPKKCFDSYAQLEFEDTKFKAPNEWDVYLKTTFGDYMKLPPEDKRKTHNPVEIKL